MKRNIMKKFETIKKKMVLSLTLAIFAMTNTGFTNQNEEVTHEADKTAEIEEIEAKEPTSIAIDENGQIKISEEDDLTKVYAEIIEKTLAKDLSGTLEESYEKISTVEVVEEPPQNVVETSQGLVEYTDVMGMEATAYLPTDGSAEGITAMGIPATYGIVAVDPDIIPLGTRVYIPGYGEALAADTGGAIYGYRIDLCMENYYEAMDFGRQTVTVFVLK